MAGSPGLASAQSSELKQLELDIAQLTLVKNMYQEMQQSYTTLEQGYENIKGISMGTFNLQQGYQDSLYLVSPSVRGDPVVAATIQAQVEMVQAYDSAFGRFKVSPYLTAGEIAYLGNLYQNLLNRSAQDIQELTLIMTDGALSMTDAERLSVINRIHQSMVDRLALVRSIGTQVTQLINRRTGLQNGTDALKKLYGL